MKTRKISHIIFPIVLISALLSSCFEDALDLNKLSKDVSIGTSLVLPIGETSISIEDVLSKLTDGNENIPVKTENGVVIVFFEQEIEIPEFGDILNIESYKYNTQTYQLANYINDLPLTIENEGTRTYTIDNSFTFTENDNPSQLRIDSVSLKGTSISIKTISNIDFPEGFLNIRIPLPAEFTGIDYELINYDVKGTETITEINAPDCMLNVSATNTLNFPIILTMSGNGSITIPEDGYITIEVNINDVQFIAYGFFNQQIDNLAGSITNLGIFDKIPEGNNIYLANPTLKIDVSSNIGIPIDLKINKLRTYETNDPNTDRTAKFNGETSTTITIQKADTPDEMKTTSITFNKDFGEINRLVEIKADNFEYDLGLSTNCSSTGNELYFISSERKITAKASIEVPIWLNKESKLTYSDTIKNVDQSLSQLEEIEYIEEAMLKLHVTNKLPFKTSLELKLLDENNNVINPTKEYKYSIKAAYVNNEGETVTENASDIKIIYDSQTVTDLKQAKHIVFTASLEGYDENSQMKLMLSDWIKVKVSAYVKAGVKASLNDFQ
jgi:hypothetical protein